MFAPFCDSIDHRHGKTEPFVIDGWKYATDGHGCICAPASDDEQTPYADRLPPVHQLPWDALRRAWWGPLPANPPSLRVRRKCDACDGTTAINWERCPECEGTGSEEEGLEDDEVPDDCRECYGTGYVDGEGCPWCTNGQVTVEDGMRALCGTYIDTRYYHGIAQLTNPEVSFDYEHTAKIAKPLLFRAEGRIYGMVSPMDPEKVQPEEDKEVRHVQQS